MIPGEQLFAYIAANLVDFLLLLLCWVLAAAIWIVPFAIYFYLWYILIILCGWGYEKIIYLIKRRK